MLCWIFRMLFLLRWFTIFQFKGIIWESVSLRSATIFKKWIYVQSLIEVICLKPSILFSLSEMLLSIPITGLNTILAPFSQITPAIVYIWFITQFPLTFRRLSGCMQGGENKDSQEIFHFNYFIEILRFIAQICLIVINHSMYQMSSLNIIGWWISANAIWCGILDEKRTKALRQGQTNKTHFNWNLRATIHS